MSSISHFAGGDLLLDATGGLALADGDLDTRQRIIRRLCTNAGDYIWHLDYGAGLPGRIGSPVNEADVRAIVLSQMQLETGVDQTKAISVAVTAQGNGQYACAISYTDAATGAVQTVGLAN